jgi:nucleoside-diphosphate-sugar epimerase
MIGTALIKECLLKGIGVTAVLRPGSINKARLPKSDGVEAIECGLNEINKLEKILKPEHDAFFHLGWANTNREGRVSPEKQNENIAFTLEAVRAAKNTGCKVFVGAGSQAEYGRVSGSIPSNLPVHPETAYGVAKYAAGRLSAMLCDELGIKNIWTRVFSVYGPNDGPDTMISYCIKALLNGEKPALTKCGQLWDYLYCSDAAKALLLACEKGLDKAVYNIGSGTAKPLSEYVEAIRAAIDPKLAVGIGEKKYAADQVMQLCADISGLKKDTGFMPAVPFENGIRETIKWHRENQL